MTTYSKNDFFTIYRGWDNKIQCYIKQTYVCLTYAKLKNLKDCTIDVQGLTFKVTLESVTKI